MTVPPGHGQSWIASILCTCDRTSPHSKWEKNKYCVSSYAHLHLLTLRRIKCEPSPQDVPAYSEGAILFEDDHTAAPLWVGRPNQVSTSPPLPASVTPPAVVMTNWTVDIDESVIHPSDELHAPRVWLSLGMQRMRKGPACWSSRCANVGIAIVVRIYSPIFSHHFLITGHFLCLQDLPWGLNQMVLPLFREINMAGLLWILFLQMIDLACD